MIPIVQALKNPSVAGSVSRFSHELLVGLGLSLAACVPNDRNRYSHSENDHVALFYRIDDLLPERVVQRKIN